MVTSWDYGADWYGNYVNQDVVNTMVDEGLTRLTGYTQVSQAWNALLPGYTPGKAIAIKVNLNNSDCGVSNNLIDALIDPVNALIRGMKQIGVVENDIWIFDAIRVVPARMKNRCLYPGVRFLDNGCSGNSQAGFTSTHPDATIHFSHSALSDRKVTDALVNASYVINMPVLKDHGISAVTLGFKNHYGSINQIIKTPIDSLHPYIDPGNAAYSASYSPLVEIYNNPNIHNKTRLVVGDGLIGAFGGTTNDSPPVRWSSFGNAAANSLFFSLDPVAVECVMFDVLSAEPGYHPQRGPNEDNHLRLASQAGLGVYERGDPWAGGYTAIEYQKIELS